MPRRLGDDPLARAKAAAAEAQVAIVTASGSSARTSTRGAYNDVFFRRRGEAAATSAPAVVERPEISEISEIPEMREAAAAPVVEEAQRP